MFPGIGPLVDYIERWWWSKPDWTSLNFPSRRQCTSAGPVSTSLPQVPPVPVFQGKVKPRLLFLAGLRIPVADIGPRGLQVLKE